MDYKDQFVLTGEIDKIGEAITRNMPKSYRIGVELEAAWKPVDWFRWDANATLSKNRVKDITVQLTDGSVADLWQSAAGILSRLPAEQYPDFLLLRFQGFCAEPICQ